MMTPEENRRTQYRMKFNGRVEWWDSAGKAHQGRGRNAGSNGVCFASSVAPAVGDQLKLRVHFMEDDPEPNDVDAEVIRVEREDNVDDAFLVTCWVRPGFA